MRTLYTYSFLALTFAAVASAQIVLDPSPARVAGHPSTTPAEQLLVTNLNPNLGVNGGLLLPALKNVHFRRALALLGVELRPPPEVQGHHSAD